MATKDEEMLDETEADTVDDTEETLPEDTEADALPDPETADADMDTESFEAPEMADDATPQLESEGEADDPDGLPETPPGEFDEEIDSIVDSMMEGDDDTAKQALKALVANIVAEAVQKAARFIDETAVAKAKAEADFYELFNSITANMPPEQETEVWKNANAKMAEYQQSGMTYVEALGKTQEDMMSEHPAEEAPDTETQEASTGATTRQVEKPDEAIDTAQTAAASAAPADQVPTNRNEVLHKMRKDRGLA